MDSICMFDPIKEINEIRNQLSLSKRMGFFFGAGTSMSLGMPGIVDLTQQVLDIINPDFNESLQRITEDLNNSLSPKKATIEDILNHIRLIRQITQESPERSYHGTNGEQAKKLDIEICNKIYDILSLKEDEITSGSDSKLRITQKFFAWLNLLGRDYSKEVFTANYDLIFEKALETLQIPYFDGFSGAYEPFFVAESIEGRDIREYPPLSWIRIWKVHGSLGWFWKPIPSGRGYRVIRLGKQAKANTSNELVIYPSREKYESSRKQPFTAYFDRMKHYLCDGEGIFIVSGYSFSDEHINEIIFNALKHNNRLHIMCFLYKDEDLRQIKDHAKCFLNMSVFSPKEAIVGGNHGVWKLKTSPPTIEFSNFWNTDNNELILGDFSKLVKFLADTSGKNQIIDKELEAKNEA